eukprot:938269-Rhodomonas_salina.1
MKVGQVHLHSAKKAVCVCAGWREDITIVIDVGPALGAFFQRMDVKNPCNLEFFGPSDGFVNLKPAASLKVSTLSLGRGKGGGTDSISFRGVSR